MKTQLLHTIKQHGRSLFLVLAAGVAGFSANAQSWATQSTMITENINGISFRENSDEGMAVANGGRIIKTTDGGITWSIQNSGTTKDLNAVYMTSLDSAYIVGDSGLVMITGDGGATWTTLTSGTGEDLNDIHMMDGKGYIAGNGGVILRVEGDNVSMTTSNTTVNLHGVYVLDGSTAFVSGGGLLNSTLLATYNDGAVWASLSTGTLNTLNAVYFINDSIGYAVGNLGTIIKTTNTGSSWTTLTSGTTSNLNAVKFLTVDSGYAVGASGNILRTINGGTTWTSVASGVAVTLNDIDFPANYEGYAAGNTGTIAKTCPYAWFEIMPKDSICMGSGATFSNRSRNGGAYTWIEDGDTVGSNINYFSTYDTAGTYSMTLIVDNGTCTDMYTHMLYVEDSPSVDLGPDTTICSGCSIVLDAGNNGSDYMWYKDGIATGVITRGNTVGVSGTYSVRVITRSGCEAWDSVMVSVATGIRDMNKDIRQVSVHPNPNNKVFTLGFAVDNRQNTDVKIVNYMGAVVYSENLADFSGAYNRNISLEQFSAGVYFVNITTNSGTQAIKVIAY
jgi:photosystem II stability/assembly factor-like uncharacterized protein